MSDPLSIIRLLRNARDFAEVDYTRLICSVFRHLTSMIKEGSGRLFLLHTLSLGGIFLAWG
jgi:hypothetical protein